MASLDKANFDDWEIPGLKSLQNHRLEPSCLISQYHSPDIDAVEWFDLCELRQIQAPSDTDKTKIDPLDYHPHGLKTGNDSSDCGNSHADAPKPASHSFCTQRPHCGA